MKNNCWLFERRFKIQENGTFLYEISVFVLKILRQNPIEDGAISGFSGQKSVPE